MADNTMVVIPLLENPEAAPAASIDEFPKEETLFKKIFKVVDEEGVPGKPAHSVICCSTETSTKAKDAKHGDNNLLPRLKEHKVVIEPVNLDLGKVKKLRSLLFRHPSHTNQNQLVADATKILSTAFKANKEKTDTHIIPDEVAAAMEDGDETKLPKVKVVPGFLCHGQKNTRTTALPCCTNCTVHEML
jgi:hypothetical protein